MKRVTLASLGRSEQRYEGVRELTLSPGKGIWPLPRPRRAGCWTSSRKNKKAAAEHLEALNNGEKRR